MGFRAQARIYDRRVYDRGELRRPVRSLMEAVRNLLDLLGPIKGEERSVLTRPVRLRYPMRLVEVRREVEAPAGATGWASHPTPAKLKRGTA